MTSWPKTADFGGESDVSFEQAFSNIAHAVLQSKAPKLQDYEIGFQLLDRDEDDTKATGVFGFKVGSQWLLAPMFFLSGKIKGTELLYIKNQDLFVPLKENWINYLLNRRPVILGDGTDKDVRNIGVIPPDLRRLVESPSKYGSARMPNWVQNFLPVYASLLRNPMQPFRSAKYASVPSLPAFLKAAAPAVTATLVKMASASPRFLALLEQFHGQDFLSDVVSTVSQRRDASRRRSVLAPGNKTAASATRESRQRRSVLSEHREHPVKTGALRVIDYAAAQADSSLRRQLSQRDLAKLASGDIVVHDKRASADMSTAYVERSKTVFTNPTETGLYDVVMGDSNTAKCLVIINPQGPNVRGHRATVVRLKDKQWSNTHPGRIWVTKHYESAEWRKFIKGLPTPTKLSPAKDSRHIMLNAAGNGTVPFRVDRTIGAADGHTVYVVRFEGRMQHETPEIADEQWDNYSRLEVTAVAGYVQPDKGGVVRDHLDHYSQTEVPRVMGRDVGRVAINDTQNSEITVSNTDVTVPAGFHHIEVPNTLEQGDAPGTAASRGKLDTGDLGTLSNLRLDAETKTAALRVTANGYAARVNGGPAMSKTKVIEQLITGYGLGELSARQIVKQADDTGELTVRVKLAAPFLTDGGPSAPAIPDPRYGAEPVFSRQVPSQYEQQDALAIPDMTADPGAATMYQEEMPDPNILQSAIQAGQTGQREVFDTALIGNLLKAHRDDMLIDQHLGDLLKGLDRVGRLLFLFYANQAQFAERYGDADMPELEDGLRGTFEALGDLVLFLKQKTIQSGTDQLTDINLKGIAE